MTWSPGSTLAQSIHDHGRVLDYSENECAGVPDCVTVESGPLVLEAQAQDVLVVSCPDGHPNMAHWDTEQHEHIEATFVQFTEGELTITAVNHGAREGLLTVFLGCSVEPSPRSDRMMSRLGLPTKSEGLRGSKRRFKDRFKRHEPFDDHDRFERDIFR